MSDTEEIAGRVAGVRERIAAACRRAGRDPGEVRLLLATKTVPPDRVKSALAAGERCLGENRVQEALPKAAALAGEPAEWHFIGHLQTNKVRDVLRFADVIQSVDRPALAEALDKRLRAEGRFARVLLQVNTSREPSKFGVAPQDAVAFARLVAGYGPLRIEGLMTIGRLGASPEDARPSFRLLREVRDRIVDAGIPGVHLTTLSMGMSADLEVAVEEGATMVRVGTAVFGTRPDPDRHYWPEAGRLGTA